MISKDRNFSSYNYYSIPRFLHGQILFHLDNPDPNPVERKTISNPNPKKSKYPAGLDSKILILYTTGSGFQPTTTWSKCQYVFTVFITLSCSAVM